jgi:hypothetical protein
MSGGEGESAGKDRLNQSTQRPQRPAPPLLCQEIELIAVEIWTPHLVLEPLGPDLTHDRPDDDQQVLPPRLRDIEHPETIEQRTGHVGNFIACGDVSNVMKGHGTLDKRILQLPCTFGLEERYQDIG